MVKTSVTHSAIASCATFLFLPHFDVICYLLLNRRTATWNLFVNHHIVTMSKYGHSALNIRRAYSTDILWYTYFCASRRKVVVFPAFFFPTNVENCALSSICWIINNYPAQSCGILPDFSQLGLRPRRLSIRRYSARFRRIIVKYLAIIVTDMLVRLAVTN